MNDLDLIRELRAEVPLPTPAELQASRERLLAAMHFPSRALSESPLRPVRRPPRVRRAVTVCTLAAVILAAILSIGDRSHGGGQPSTGAPAAASYRLAAEVLRRAAVAAGARPGHEPAPAQWIYAETVDQPAHGARSVDESWERFDGSEEAYFAGGQLVVHAKRVAPAGEGSALSVYARQTTPLTAYDALASLPASPAVLLRAVDVAVSANPSEVAPAGASPLSHSTRQELEFAFLTNLLWNAAQAAPGHADAAVFKALASIPGVAAEAGVFDAAGRPAIAVSDEHDSAQLLLDPATYEVTGLRVVSDGHWPKNPLLKNSPDLPAGSVIDSLAWATIAYVTEPGARDASSRSYR